VRDTTEKWRLSPSLVVAVIALFVALAGTTWANTGGNFILGKGNTADHTTSLNATASGPALKAVNTGTGGGIVGTSGNGNGIMGESTAPNVAGVYALSDGTSPGFGLHAISVHGVGVGGQGAIAGGQFNGIGDGDGVQGASSAGLRSGVYAHHDGPRVGYGVFANAVNGYGVLGTGSSAGGTFKSVNGGDGVQGASTAAAKSGVWGHHDGAANGYGVFAQSAVGPAIGMLGNSSSPPMTLNGKPFPSVTAGWHDDFLGLPSDNTYHPIAALDLAAGAYLILTTMNVEADRNNRVECELVAGSDRDKKVALGDTAWSTMTLMVFHTFTGPGSALLQCFTPDKYSSLVYIKMAALQVSGGTNTQFP